MRYRTLGFRRKLVKCIHRAVDTKGVQESYIEDEGGNEFPQVVGEASRVSGERIMLSADGKSTFASVPETTLDLVWVIR